MRRRQLEIPGRRSHPPFFFTPYWYMVCMYKNTSARTHTDTLIETLCLMELAWQWHADTPRKRRRERVGPRRGKKITTRVHPTFVSTYIYLDQHKCIIGLSCYTSSVIITNRQTYIDLSIGKSRTKVSFMSNSCCLVYLWSEWRRGGVICLGGGWKWRGIRPLLGKLIK